MLTQVKIVTCNNCKDMQQVEDEINKALVELYKESSDTRIDRIDIHEHGVVITYSGVTMRFVQDRLKKYGKADDVESLPDEI